MKRFIILSTFFSLCFCNVFAQQLRNHPGAVYYEIFVRSFSDSNGDGIGDIPGITQKLDYLKTLGIKGIWLTPVHPSPTYHKYDVKDYRAIDPEYGTIDDMKTLVREAHARDISIIMDYVVNHTSSQHPWFSEAINNPKAPSRNYYIWAEESESHRWQAQPYNQGLPWQWHKIDSTNPDKGRYYGFFWREMPDLNFDDPIVRTTMIEHAKFWLSEVGIDGFRLDAAQHVYELNEHHKSIAWWEEFRKGVESVKKDVYLVGEIVNADSIVTGYFSGLKANFHFDLGKQILTLLKEEKASSDFVDKLSKSIQAHKEKRSDCIDAIFLTNHDQDRIMSELNGDKEKALLAASILLTLPGQPFLYYGEEIGMLGKKPDEAIREPILWTDGGKDSNTTKWETLRFNIDPNNSVHSQKKGLTSIWGQYAFLISFRHAMDDLLNGSIYPFPTPPGLLGYLRNNMLIIHNLTNREQILPIQKDFKFFLHVPTYKKIADEGKIAPYSTMFFQRLR
ncbi:MAG: alpha-amylase family glycosyl hydrolase [Candidatus Kapaibacteriota bacterium]